MNFQFTKFTPLEYMYIEIANTFGLDKQIYKDRLDWVKTNLDNLEDFIDTASDKFLFIKAVKNLREVQAGKPVGALVGFDANCSGIQILSVLTRCIAGCIATGAINSDERPSAYLLVQEEMQNILGEAVDVDYEAIKLAVMSSCYGSKAEPKKLFDGDALDAFNAACRVVAPGAFNLLPLLRDTWNTESLSHDWVMPDGFNVHIPVITTDIIKLEIEELANYPMSTLITKNERLDFSVSNVAK